MKAEQFTKQPHLALVINSINTSLSNIGESSVQLIQKLWPAIDEEVGLSEWFSSFFLVFLDPNF